MAPLESEGFDDFEPFSPQDGCAQNAEGPRTVLTFRLGAQVFAADVGSVREVVDLCAIAPMPGAPHSVLGMIDLREEQISIIDLADRLGLPFAEGEHKRIIVFTFGEGQSAFSLGVVADQVLRVCEIDSTSLEPMPETRTGWKNADIEGLVRIEEGSAMVLGIERILCGQQQLPGEFDFG
jgi:purine-binding chemotaxis protein CheW